MSIIWPLPFRYCTLNVFPGTCDEAQCSFKGNGGQSNGKGEKKLCMKYSSDKCVNHFVDSGNVLFTGWS